MFKCCGSTPKIKIERLSNWPGLGESRSSSAAKTDIKTYILATAIIISVIAILAGILAIAGINPLALMGDTASKSLIFGGIGLLAVSLISYVISATLKNEPKTLPATNRAQASSLKLDKTEPPMGPPARKKRVPTDFDDLPQATIVQLQIPDPPPRGVSVENLLSKRKENLGFVRNPITVIIRDWTPEGLQLAFEAFKNGAQVFVLISADKSNQDYLYSPLNDSEFKRYIKEEFKLENLAQWYSKTCAILDWLASLENGFEYVDNDQSQDSEWPQESNIKTDWRYSGKRLKIDGQYVQEKPDIQSVLEMLQSGLRSEPVVPQIAQSKAPGEKPPNRKKKKKSRPKSGVTPVTQSKNPGSSPTHSASAAIQTQLPGVSSGTGLAGGSTGTK